MDHSDHLSESEYDWLVQLIPGDSIIDAYGKIQKIVSIREEWRPHNVIYSAVNKFIPGFLASYVNDILARSMLGILWDKHVVLENHIHCSIRYNCSPVHY